MYHVGVLAELIHLIKESANDKSVGNAAAALALFAADNDSYRKKKIGSAG